MRKLITFIFAMALVVSAQAQDPEFTQFYANPLYLNPAFAGTAQGPRFSMNYRNQWSSISAGFITYAASYDEHFDGIGGGIGLQAWYDRAGDGELSTVDFSGIYSYHLNVTRTFAIKAGLEASYMQRSIDFSKLRFGDQIDARLGFVRPTQEQFPTSNGLAGPYSGKPIVDFSAGLLGFTEKYYIGFAVDHITEPTQSFFGNPQSILPRKFTGHMGMMIPLQNVRNPKDFISPNILVQRQGKFTQVDFGAYVIKGPLIAGAWFRQTGVNSDAIMALIGIKKDILKIGYSYDLTVSNAKSAARGSHEVSLILELKRYDHSKTTKWRDLHCPSF